MTFSTRYLLTTCPRAHQGPFLHHFRPAKREQTRTGGPNDTAF